RMALWDVVVDCGLRIADCGLVPRARNAVSSFANLIQEMRAIREKATVTELAQAVLDKTGYLAELEAERSMESQTRAENVRELLTVTTRFEAESEDRSLAGFLEQVSLVSDLDDAVMRAEGQQADSRVTMMTLH